MASWHHRPLHPLLFVLQWFLFSPTELDSVNESHINDNSEECSSRFLLILKPASFLALIWTIYVMPSMPICLLLIENDSMICIVSTPYHFSSSQNYIVHIKYSILLVEIFDN